MFPTSSDFHDLRMTQREIYARKLYLGTFKETNYKKIKKNTHCFYTGLFYIGSFSAKMVFQTGI